MVATAIEAHRIDPRLHRVLAEQIPRTGRLKHIEAFNRDNYALVRSYLEVHSDELRAVDLGLAAFVCVTAIEALAHTAVLHRSDMLSDDERSERSSTRSRVWWSGTCDSQPELVNAAVGSTARIQTGSGCG